MPCSNIAYVHYWELPSLAASSVHVMKMCQAFQQEGYHTLLYAPRATMSPVKDVWHHYGIKDPFSLRLLRPIPVLRKQDIALRAAWQAYRRPNTLVFARNLAGAMWSAALGVPTLFESHELGQSWIAQLYTRRLFRSRGFRGLVVISQPLRDKYLEQYPGLIRADQIHVEPDAVDLERFANQPDLATVKTQLNLTGFVAGYVGHLYPGRGVELILALAQALPQITFLLIGGNQTDVQHWQEETASMSNIRFTGFISNSELPSYMAGMDVFLMPYQRKVTVWGGRGNTVDWMSPMKMFEYMAGERPIISSDLPALRTILNEQNAILCDPEDGILLI